jgi:hypothetical protein
MRDAMGAEGRRTVREEFAIDVCAARLAEVMAANGVGS